MNDVMSLYQKWLNSTAEHEEIHRELVAISGCESEIEDRFYRELEFGTGGLRGVLGVGSNRMNVYTVAKATQGLSEYLNKSFEHPSVAIGYDSRINSDLFAETAAAVFASNGIQVWMYDHLMPTPALSFAVRDLKCTGGVVITASHNPSKYNGYKVYGADGCQITTEAARLIQKEIDSVDVFEGVKCSSFGEQMEAGMISYIGEDTVARYLAAVSTASVLPSDIARDVEIVYTPLNGAGISCVPQALAAHGFSRITIPDEQKDPDGHFPTCPYPNPEVREALEVGLRWAKQKNCDLLLATDPDCDRVGAAIRDGDEYKLITGNEMGVLLFDFVCSMRRKAGTMPDNPVAVKTIVTTPMASRVAQHYGVELRDVLTGFKFIGEQIGLLEKAGEVNRYIFGFEESYGYLSGSFVRDKDAVNASLLICEMFAWYKAQDLSLADVLERLYQQYGFYYSRLLSFAFEGSSGFAAMQKMMLDMREKKPKEIAGFKVTAISDYLHSVTTNSNGEYQKIDLPKSNVLRFFLEGGAEAVIRPSGTEPKIKIYLTTTAQSMMASKEIASTLEAYFTEWVKA